jgi:hypothetical protein
MLPARPTSSWLESNNNSLHQTQGSSVRQSITGRLKARIPGTGTIHMDVLDLQVCSHPTLRLSVQTPVRPSDHQRLADLMTPSP